MLIASPKTYKNVCLFSTDQEMDGMAIVQTFGTASGPDCLRDVISKFGTRVKVYSAIKFFLSKNMNEVNDFYLCASTLLVSLKCILERICYSFTSVYSFVSVCIISFFIKRDGKFLCWRPEFRNQE